MTGEAPTELRLQGWGLRLAAKAWGPPDGRPVLALHGWLDNAASFDRLIPLLPDDLRLVALDLPGHGFSEHLPASSHYHYLDWIPQILAAVESLAWQRFSLLGHSMGAGIATLVAGTLVDRVERAALIEGLGPLTTQPEDAADQLAGALADRLERRERAPRPYPDRQAAIKVRRQQRFAPLSEEAAAIIVDRGTEQGLDGVRWRHDPRLRSSSLMRFTEAQVHGFLRRIACPLLVIIAESGWPFPEAIFDERFACLEDGRLARAPGTHHLHLETPEAVAGTLGDFFASA